MTFLSPLTAIIAAGIAVPALVALYFLKLRRRPMVVPTTLLWKKAVRDMEVNAPFQRMRKNLLLLIQLLLLALLLFAMARPTMRQQASPGRQVVIAIDHSASMNAADGNITGTRLDTAKAAAKDIIDALGSVEGGSANAMIVAFADRATVMQSATSDLTLLRRAVDVIEPTDRPTALGPAMDLLRNLAPASSDGSEPVIHVLSDGRSADESGTLTSLPGVDLRFVQVASDPGPGGVNNVGIVAFGARRSFDKPQIVEVFARLANHSRSAQSVNVSLQVDGQTTRVTPMNLPAADDQGPGQQATKFNLVIAESAMVRLSHDHDDLLAADDAASMVLAPARRLRALLVTNGNAFLDRVIRSSKVRDLVTMTPDRFEDQKPELLRRGGWDASSGGGDEGFDVIVFDNYAPKQVPLVSSLYLGSVPDLEGLSIEPPRENDPKSQAVLDWRRDHPLMRYVALDDIILSQPGRIVMPDDGVVLATGQTGPIIATVTRDGVTHVVTSFNVLASNWPLYISFPVFVTNSLTSLGMGGLLDEAGLSYRSGQLAVVPVRGGGEQITFDGPEQITGKVRQGVAVLPAFDLVGTYLTSDALDPPFDRLPVNLLSPGESDLSPAERLEVGTTAAVATTAARSVRREVWHYFVWGALAMLMIEWIVYTQRMHL